VATPAASAPANAAIIAAARAGEPDRYLAALLAPAAARQHLLALAAFLGELRRAVALVREPAMGEIRLQWWREALALDGRMRTGNPVADALRDAARLRALPAPLLSGIIDARASELAAAMAPDNAGREDYLWKGEGAAFLLAGLILGGGEAELAKAATAAGRAYGLARLLQGAPWVLARGSLTAAGHLRSLGLAPGADGEGVADRLAEILADVRRHLAVCRQQVANLPREARSAFLPLALVGPYVRSLERRGEEGLRTGVAIAPMTRLARMVAAHWLNRM
jgi:phytoene synthase